MARVRQGDMCPKCRRGTVVRRGKRDRTYLACSRPQCPGIWSVSGRRSNQTGRARPLQRAPARKPGVRRSGGSTAGFLLVAAFLVVFVIYLAAQH
jgi:ssDNA-binding Zn-finger/Zn-ribbon topoisomerase 1